MLFEECAHRVGCCCPLPVCPTEHICCHRFCPACFPCCAPHSYAGCAEAQEFKKGFEAAAESNSAIINAAAVPAVAGDGTAEAADKLADELGGKVKVEDEAAAPAAAEAEPAKAEAA